MGKETSSMMTVDQLAERSGVTVRSVKKNYEKIPGHVIKNKTILFPAGSRYPFNLRSSNVNETYGQLKAIMRAIKRNRFIDAEMLKIKKDEFDDLLAELHDGKYIKPNHSGNAYGCNNYSLTLLGGQFVDNIDKIDRKVPQLIGAGNTALSAISIIIRLIGIG